MPRRRIALALAALFVGAVPLPARAADPSTQGTDPSAGTIEQDRGATAESRDGSTPSPAPRAVEDDGAREQRGGAPPFPPAAAVEPRGGATSPPSAAPAPLGASGLAPASSLAAASEALGPTRRRALWVLAEGSQRVLEHRERLEWLLADARALGATDLFVQVYRGGRAWFDSSLADATPWGATWREPGPGGADALTVLVERAHADGLRVHAWVNVLSLASNPTAPIVRELGAGAVLVDQWGRSLLDYPGFDVPPEEKRHVRMGTPGVYLDPAAPGVAERLAATFEELLRRYPGLDGLHLDYIRYPDTLPFSPGTRFGGLNFGYGQATRARFRAETGLEPPFGASLENASRFDAWRRDELSALVARIRERATAARPAVALSAAVFHDDERAYLTVFQDWRGWLEASLVDFAVPMLYSTDERIVRYRVAELAGLPEARRIWIGLGSWLFGSDPARAVAQARLVESTGALGLSLFSWDSIREKPALRDALAAAATRDGLAAGPAASPAPAAAIPDAATAGATVSAAPADGAAGATAAKDVAPAAATDVAPQLPASPASAAPEAPAPAAPPAP